MADFPALSFIFTFSDLKTCLKPSNAKCVNWFWSVYPKSILSPIASDLKFLLLMPRVTDIGKVERKILHRQMCYRKKAQMVSHAHPSNQKNIIESHLTPRRLKSMNSPSFAQRSSPSSGTTSLRATHSKRIVEPDKICHRLLMRELWNCNSERWFSESKQTRGLFAFFLAT